MQNKFPLLFALLLLLSVATGYAQDVIRMKDGSKMKVRIVEITGTEIKFYKIGSTDLNTYFVDKKDAAGIQYENGDVTTFKFEEEDVEDNDVAVQDNKSGGFYDQPYQRRNNGTFGKSVGILNIGYGFGVTQLSLKDPDWYLTTWALNREKAWIILSKV